KEQQLEWVEDSSNASTKYTRNYIRHEVLPLVKQVFPTVMQNLGGSIERWRESGVLYRQAVEKVKSGLCEVLGNEVHIPVLKLKKSSPLKTIVFEIIKDFGFSAAQSDEVIGLLESGSGKYVASASHRVLRNRNWLIIAPNQTESSNHILIETDERELEFPLGKLEVERTVNCQPRLKDAVGQASTVNSIATLDASHITFPLLLRRWKQGDYFYPLGMRKKKKLSRFLIDNKVSVIDKENTWVIESDKRIIWVVGRRIDDRFKIIPSTKQVLRLSITNR
ncbi:MAG: tilS, partial [Chitinophagaceae bacterium]|nr:tilS [Chitinophagaceae bacterium]